MYSVFLKDGTLCKNSRKILHEQEMFYKDLYTSNPKVNFNMKNHSEVLLNEIQRDLLDKDINFTEIKEAIDESKRNKVAGGDGIPVEFYAHFYSELRIPLYKLFLEIQKTGSMTRSMKRGSFHSCQKAARTQDT